MPNSIEAQLATLTALVQHIDKRAEEERKERRDAMAATELTRQAVSAELHDLRHGQADVLRRLDKVEPVADLVNSFKAKMAGGLLVLGTIGTLLWTGGLFFKDIIIGWWFP